MATEHAVIITINLSGGEFGSPEEVAEVRRTTVKLGTILDSKSLGELDGDEFGGHKCTVYTYGPDADLLFDECNAVCAESYLFVGAHVVKRYGDASDVDAREEVTSISK